MLTKSYVKTRTALAEKLEDQKGEIASWMIVLGFLVVAAVAAKEQIGGAIEGLIGETAGKIGPAAPPTE